jgi:hypothetical protein
MSVRFVVVALVFVMVLALLSGVGTVLVLASPLSAFAMQLMPGILGISLIVSLPVSWMVAPVTRTSLVNRSPSLRSSDFSYRGDARAAARSLRSS